MVFLFQSLLFVSILAAFMVLQRSSAHNMKIMTTTKTMTAQDILNASTFQVTLDPQKISKIGTWDWGENEMTGKQNDISETWMTIRFSGGRSVFWLTDIGSNQDWGSLETGDDQETAQDIIEYIRLYDDYEIVTWES
jgi:hypothetical protein